MRFKIQRASTSIGQPCEGAVPSDELLPPCPIDGRQEPKAWFVEIESLEKLLGLIQTTDGGDKGWIVSCDTGEWAITIYDYWLE